MEGDVRKKTTKRGWTSASSKTEAKLRVDDSEAKEGT